MKKTPRRKWLPYCGCFAAGIVVTILCTAFFLHHEIPVQASVPALDDKSKPWGHIDALKIPFAESEELFPDREVRLLSPNWFFEGVTEDELARLIRSWSLSANQRAELLDRSHWQVRTNGCLVLPSSPLVRGLSCAARQQIYGLLAKSQSNYAQQFPFRFRLDGFAARFDDTDLSPSKLKLLENLTYTNAQTLCFADLELLPELLAPDEFEQVVEALYRLPSYRLRLRIYPNSDIDALAKYWGTAGREKKIRPLLESMARVHHRTNGATINIGYFLPTFARLRLNTFPDAWSEPQVPKEDCFWTSMNFLNDQPDMRYLDADFVRSSLRNDYAPAKGHPTFGDLVTVFGDSGEGRHMCVYIADDFVFTKNGTNTLAPWMLMRISDMMLLFPSEQPQRAVLMRKKAATQ